MFTMNCSNIYVQNWTSIKFDAEKSDVNQSCNALLKFGRPKLSFCGKVLRQKEERSLFLQKKNII